MYAFVRRPKWILSHMLVVALIITMINLMFWQVRRLDEKKSLNREIVARADVAPREVGDLLTSQHVTKPADSDRVEFRHALVVGTYDAAHEFTIPSKTLDTAPGRLVVTPLVWSDTESPLLVMRGFIPQSVDDTKPPINGVEPPAGRVEVQGWLRQTQTPEGIQSTTAELSASSFARMDIVRIEQARHQRYAPAYLQLEAQKPETKAPLLSLYPLPQRDEGPHFSYAVQWAVFSAIAALGYPLALRRVAHGGTTRKRRDDVPSDDPPEPALVSK